VHDGLSKTDPAAKAFGQGLDGLFEHGGELQPLDDVVEPRSAPLALELPQVGDEIEKAADGHLSIGGRAFRQVAEARLRSQRIRLDVMATDAGTASTRGDEPGQHPHRRRLAGAIRTEEAEHLSRSNLEGHIVYGHERVVTLTEVFGLDHTMAQ